MTSEDKKLADLKRRGYNAYGKCKNCGQVSFLKKDNFKCEKCQELKKFDADTTCFISLYNMKGERHTICCDIIPELNIVENMKAKKITVVFPIQLIDKRFKVGDELNIIFTITNDPTLNAANGTVSLGYSCFSVTLANYKVVTLAPLVVQGVFKEELTLEIGQPARRVS